jgi:hypothetical protein
MTLLLLRNTAGDVANRDYHYLSQIATDLRIRADRGLANNFSAAKADTRNAFEPAKNAQNTDATLPHGRSRRNH